MEVHEPIMAATRLGLGLQVRGHALREEAGKEEAALHAARTLQRRVMAAWFNQVGESSAGRVEALAVVRGERVRAQRLLLRLAVAKQATRGELAAIMVRVRRCVARLVAQVGPRPAAWQGEWAWQRCSATARATSTSNPITLRSRSSAPSHRGSSHTASISLVPEFLADICHAFPRSIP